MRPRNGRISGSRRPKTVFGWDLWCSMRPVGRSGEAGGAKWGRALKSVPAPHPPGANVTLVPVCGTDATAAPRFPPTSGREGSSHAVGRGHGAPDTTAQRTWTGRTKGAAPFGTTPLCVAMAERWTRRSDSYSCSNLRRKRSSIRDAKPPDLRGPRDLPGPEGLDPPPPVPVDVSDPPFG